MTIARHIRITGRVQGVFFRAWTCEQARSLFLGGWVRNCPDGSVDVHVEGPTDQVDELVRRLHTGPPSAQVEDVEISDAAPIRGSGFSVRH